MSTYTSMTVPVGPFRERVIELHELGYSYSQIAQWCGFIRTHRGYDCGETSKLKRMVGLVAEIDHRNGSWRTRKTVTYHTACKLAEALGLDPVDVGI